LKTKKLIRKLQELDPNGNAEVVVGPKCLGIGKVVREGISTFHDVGAYTEMNTVVWIKNERQ